MNTRNRLILLALAMAIFGMLGFTGCKNACDKAASKMADCMSEFCDDEANSDAPQCSEEAQAAMGEASGGECGDAEAAMAAIIEGAECSAILDGSAFVEAAQEASE